MSNPATHQLQTLYRSEGLDAPSILSWPLSGAAEEDRLARQRHFGHNLAEHPPTGLEWISAHRDVKYRPDRVLAGCRSILVSALPYFRSDAADEAYDAAPGAASGTFGLVARYARGRDYHKELGKRLKRIARALGLLYPQHQFRSFTDIGPLDETWLAQASGLGFKGRHTLAIMPKIGSWAVLGHIVSTRVFADGPPRPSPLHCPDGCRRCIDACPTSALSMPGNLDASRCISCHSIEQKGAVNQAYLALAGNRIFGCDACQEVCPFNARVTTTRVDGFLKDIAGAALDLEELLNISADSDGDEVFKKRFAGSPLMRAGRNGMVRNACTVAGNMQASERGELEHRIRDLTQDTDEGVRIHALWALSRD